MSNKHRYCPVLGCGERRDRWKGGCYQLPPPDEFMLHLEPLLSSSTLNNMICKKCYKRHKRTIRSRDPPPPPPSSLPPPVTHHTHYLDELTAAAEQDSDISQFSPHSSPQSSHASHSSLSLLSHNILPNQSTHPSSSGLSALFPVFNVTAPPASLSSSPTVHLFPAAAIPATVVKSPRKLRRHALTDIQPTSSTSPLRDSRTYHTMQKLITEYATLSYGDKQAWLERHKLTRHQMSAYKKRLGEREALPEEERPNMQRCRLNGGGRKARLPKDVEDSIFAWVKDRRGDNPDRFCHVVTVTQLLFHACIVSDKQLLEGWLWGFMDRYGLSLRCVTTNKANDTPMIKAVLEEYRYQHREILSDKAKQPHIYNMDETCIYFDMTHKRTIGMKGEKTVPAHHTKGGSNRVSLVICVSADGQHVPPLIIYMDPPKKIPLSKLKTDKGKNGRLNYMELQNKIECKMITIPVYNKFDEDEVVIDDDEREQKYDERDKENMSEEQLASAARKLKRKMEVARRKRYSTKPTERREVLLCTSHNEKGWQVTALMDNWIDDVFIKHTTPDSQGFRYLFMDNMGAHDEAGVLEHCSRLNIKVSLLPPNYSPLLQPLDHSLNALIKYVYRLQFADFMMREIDRETEVQGDYRLRGSTKEEVAERVAAAVYALTSSHIRNCFHHTLNGEKQMKEAEEGHERRERDGTQVTIPKTRKRKRREAEEEGGRGEGEKKVKEEEKEEKMQPMEDDLQVVLNDEGWTDEGGVLHISSPITLQLHPQMHPHTLSPLQ